MAEPAPASGGSIEEQPLAPRPGPRGKTLFTIVPPEESGVRTENKYDDPEMWGRLSREFDLGAVGTGVAIGDYDNDGLPDIFVVSKTGSCRLFHNLGNWKFEDVTEKAGVGDHGAAARIWKQGATFVDVNNDGLLDIYVCRFKAPNLLYINQGDGTFKEEARAYGLDVKDGSVMAYFYDYDRDGRLDVFIQTNVLDAAAHPEGQRSYLFHNNGNGTFTNVTDRAGVAPGRAHGNSAVWWDFDGDGWPGLYVANDFDVPDALYRNNRDGTFTDVAARVVPHTPYSSMGSDLGDVNNDGRLGLLVADMAATEHVGDHRAMAAARARMRVPEEGSGEVRQFPCNALYLNTGTGRCLEAAHLAGLDATDWTWAPLWEDLDNDGRADLFVANGMYREIHNQDLMARRTMAGSVLAGGQIVRNSPVFANRHLAFRNLGGLRFEDVSSAWGLDQKGVSFGAALGDLNGDGNMDLVYSNYDGGVTLLRNTGDTGHRVICALRGTRSNRFGVGARVALESAAGIQVRTLTLGRGFMSSSEPIVHFGLGEDAVVRRLTVRWPSGAVQAFENLPADRRFTITEPSAPPAAPAPAARPEPQFAETSRAANLSWTAPEESYDEFLDQRLLPAGFNRRGPAIAVGNLDGSGRDGVCIGGTTREARRVLLPQVADAWAPAASPALAAPPGVDDGPLLLFDATGEGRADLLVTAGGASQPAGAPEYQPRLFLNDGHGRFLPAPDGTLPPLSISAGAVCAADFDHSGRLGLFIGGRVSPGLYPAPPLSVLLASRGGKFVDVTDAVAPMLRHVGMVTSALWSDVDGDGWPDLLLTLEWGQVKYFHNVGGRKFEDWTEKAGFGSAGTGWWRSIATADFNGDGRPDYVVGNVGLNTQYRADSEHPALLFSGDFAGRGSDEIVEAYYENGRLYPWRSRTDLGAAIPTVLRRFRLNNDYARATLPEILGADRLAAATRLEATELRSGVFLSQPDGRYRFEPLPRIAQIAPADGLVAGDFGGDGHADIYVVQNSYAPAPAIGRFDGGLSQLLCGDGHGHFTPVAPIESGLVVPGDAKALALLDIGDDGWPGFLVSRNGEATLAFHNRGVAGRHSLRVVLQGPPGNPQAVGARVTAEYADGTTQTGEVCAGSGYYSQSTAALFFGSAERNPLRRVRVRWPSGAATTSPDLGGSLPKTVRLVAPEP
ncbi:MAG TPA: FG-GAP-like repeat-containing protein [Opitutaceae bacterium]|nr:FG-GAP-like repeat-containing protein [Opitutaceae bacterium]